MLAMVMALSLMACGGDTGTDDANTGDDTQVEDNTGDDAATPGEGDSIMAILNDRFVAAPELAGTTWTFIGGYVQGKQMTEDQTNEVLSPLDNAYALYFDENGAVSLTEGTDTVTAGTYTISGTACWPASAWTMTSSTPAALSSRMTAPSWWLCWTAPA